MTELLPLAVSISQAVSMTGMGRTWLYSAIKRRELATRKAGRRTLIEDKLNDVHDCFSGLPECRAFGAEAAAKLAGIELSRCGFTVRPPAGWRRAGGGGGFRGAATRNGRRAR